MSSYKSFILGVLLAIPMTLQNGILHKGRSISSINELNSIKTITETGIALSETDERQLSLIKLALAGFAVDPSQITLDTDNTSERLLIKITLPKSQKDLIMGQGRATYLMSLVNELQIAYETNPKRDDIKSIDFAKIKRTFITYRYMEE